ncbi:semaphorin-3C-like [Anguilla anguilla]|uniref:semaphorin-3C-like n=1 Tax=Anguilla anguilla TaxID=7936 RepID=UPI0015A8A6B0|nr:semaphorin-3C-like [Anguilla anguilla]XP_035258185.1 semaphorin-3C-like [Anguilla anguilla]
MGRPEEVVLRSGGHGVVLALLLLLASVSGLLQMPRVFLTFKELEASQSFEHYSLSEQPLDYRILLVDEDQDRMYVGCRDHLLSLSINNITHRPLKVHWPASASKIEECLMAGKDATHGCGNYIRVAQPFNRTHLFACGSGAFSPVCAYVHRGRRSEEQVFHIDSRIESGKGRCSFSPQINTVSVMLNQELFSGMYIDFMGTDAAIFRSLTRRNAVRTDQHNSKWLSEPAFIDAKLIADGSDPDDAKLYFFFRERLTDGCGNVKHIHSMVARVCPNDVGGQRSLVNKWSTFLKARMVCVVQEPDGTETHFDELESVFLLEQEHPKKILLFAVFTSTSSVFKGSAVCVYNMADVLTVFNGPFAQRDNFQWTAYQGRIPFPRPGTCPGGAFTPNMHTTKEFPDDVVTFVRHHPMMFNPIYPVSRRPLVVRTNANYKYTAIAVDLVTATDGRYQVLFLGTDKGTVQKLVVLPTNHSLGHDLILEELEVFKNGAPVTNLRISPKKQQLYVSSQHGVSQVSLHRCHAYGSACADCCLARDPYCAWDGLSCSRFYPTGKRRSRRQDIIHGNPLTQCRGFNLKAYRNAEETVQFGVKNSTTFLECLHKSPQASVRWLVQRDSDRRKEVKPSERLVPSSGGLLIRAAQPSDEGLYYCQTTENGFRRTAARVRLRVLGDAAAAAALADKRRSAWALAGALHPKALLPAFGGGADALALQQYCKEQRQADRPRPPAPAPPRGDLAKLKPFLDRGKSRNRRNHHPPGG